MIVLLQRVTIKFRRLFLAYLVLQSVADNYYKVRQMFTR